MGKGGERSGEGGEREGRGVKRSGGDTTYCSHELHL